METSGRWSSRRVVNLRVRHTYNHGLRTPREEKAFTAWPKIHSHSQIFRYGRSIFCLPLWPNFSDIFDLCLHWVSVVRALNLSKERKSKFWRRSGALLTGYEIPKRLHVGTRNWNSFHQWHWLCLLPPSFHFFVLEHWNPCSLQPI